MAWQIALCEDNPEDRRILIEKVEQWASLHQVEINLVIFTYAHELRDAFHRFDAFLLDVYTSEEPDGWSLAERLRAQDRYAPIIFVTGSEEHILSAFALQYVIDYVKKPIVTEQLHRALDNLHSYLCSREDEVFVTTTVFSDANGERYQGVYRIPYRDLLFFRREKNSNYVLINDQEEPRLRQTIWELLQMLPPTFQQVDKGAVVNLARIHQVHGDHVLFNDTGRTRLEIGRSYRQLLIKAYTRHRMEKIF